MLRTFFAAALVMVLGVNAEATAQDAIVRISGSTSVANGIVLPHQAAIEKAAGVRIMVTPNSSGAGVTDLFAGNADIAMISSDLDDILKKMSRAVEAYKVDKSSFRTFSLGEAKVEFIVNQNNPVRKLSRDQLKAIYLGEIANWKDVGGSSAALSAYSEPRHGAMRTIVEHDLLGGKPISDTVSEVERAPQVAAMVARTPTGLGFVSSSTPADLRMGTVPVESDVRLAQHLSVITRGEPNPTVFRVIEAMKRLQ